MSQSLKIARAVGVLVVAAFPSIARADSPARPNVLVIVSDDMGWNGIGLHQGFTKTANLDRIAHSGVELDRFYVCPMCSPTRAGLMTGRYALHVGMGHTVVHPWSYDGGLPPDETTIADALAPAGYKARAIFGKWHLGHMDPKWLPLSHGFTQFRGCYTGAIDYYTHERLGEVDWHDNYANSDEQGYVTDLIADDTAAFITAHAHDPDPFFCYTAFTAPHEPLEAPQKYVDRYAALDDDPQDGKPSRKQLMAALVAALDDGVGRILNAIHRAGIADRTLIIYFNDNGGLTTIPDNNYPLRGGKFTVYEGGVRVPAAVWWPGHIEGGRKIETRTMNIDILPTLLTLCHAPKPKTAGPLDGQDLTPVLLNPTGKKHIAKRDLFFFCGQYGTEKERIAVTAADGWKLIVIGPDVRRSGGCTSPGHRVELYNLNDDPLEQHDLAGRYPDRVDSLALKLIAFRSSEPARHMRPINRKPADFQPPAHWYIRPASDSARAGGG